MMVPLGRSSQAMRTDSCAERHELGVERTQLSLALDVGDAWPRLARPRPRRPASGASQGAALPLSRPRRAEVELRPKGDPADPGHGRRAARAAADDPRAAQGPVFADRRGRPLRYSTVFNRVWAPARKAAALDWAGLHALWHTCASLLIDEGRSPVQIAAWLGHHSPAFSMAVYGHLMDDGVGEGLHLTPPVIAA